MKEVMLRFIDFLEDNALLLVIVALPIIAIIWGVK